MKNKIIARVPGFDGSQIAAVVIWGKNSHNRKTGDNNAQMDQIYFVPVDMSPLDHARTKTGCIGTCGSCTMKARLNPDTGKIMRECYVRTEQAPHAIHKAVKRGAYAEEFIPEDFIGHNVRFGAFGCPTLLGESAVSAIAGKAKAWTGYSHEWRIPSRQWARSFFMASVNSKKERLEAKSKGWRTARVTSNAADLMTGEMLCPAFKGVHCVNCNLCNGTAGNGLDIVFPAHGSGKNHVKG